MNSTVITFEEWRARGLENHPEVFEAFLKGQPIESYHVIDDMWYTDRMPSWAADVCYRVHETEIYRLDSIMEPIHYR